MFKGNKISSAEIFIIAFCGFIAYLPFLGSVHLFDWDEVNFAECAREMLVSKNYLQPQINFEPFYEKPPLFFWIQTASMKIFGVNEFAGRFPNAVCGVMTLVLLYILGTKQKNKTFGLFWTGLYLGSIATSAYFKSGIIDPLFNLFIFLGIYQLVRHEQMDSGKKNMSALFAGIFIGLATLTKGPVALLITILCFIIYKIFVRNFRISILSVLVFAFAYLFIIFLWFGILTLKDGTEFVKQFVHYQMRLFSTSAEGHSGPIYYHLVVFLLGCFPISAFAFRGQLLKPEENNLKTFHRYMNILFWAVLILFSIVKTKIIHYSSLIYFPASFAAAEYLYEAAIEKRKKLSADILILLFLGVLVWGTATALLPYLAHHANLIEPYLKDDFAKANLKIAVQWQGWEWTIGVLYLFGGLFSIIQLFRKKFRAAFFGFILTNIIWLNLSYKFLLPKIEHYVQGPSINFFQSLCGKNVIVDTYGYKSYAPYFYGCASKEDKTGKDIYLCAKIGRAEELKQNCPECVELSREGGFVFFVKKRKD